MVHRQSQSASPIGLAAIDVLSTAVTTLSAPSMSSVVDDPVATPGHVIVVPS